MTVKEPGVRYSYRDRLPEIYVGMPCDIQLELGYGGMQWSSINLVCLSGQILNRTLLLFRRQPRAL